MTNIGTGRFNITILSTQSNQLGEYDWVAFCCEGTNCAAGYGIFEVTPSGSDAINSGEGISLSLAILSILVMGIFPFIPKLTKFCFKMRIRVFYLLGIKLSTIFSD